MTILRIETLVISRVKKDRESGEHSHNHGHNVCVFVCVCILYVCVHYVYPSFHCLLTHPIHSQQFTFQNHCEDITVFNNNPLNFYLVAACNCNRCYMPSL